MIQTIGNVITELDFGAVVIQPSYYNMSPGGSRPTLSNRGSCSVAFIFGLPRHRKWRPLLTSTHSKQPQSSAGVSTTRYANQLLLATFFQFKL